MKTWVLEAIDKLKSMQTSYYGGDFFLTWERTDEEIKFLAYLAKTLKELHKENFPLKLFETGLAVSNFRDKSTRTRFSFASAANLLGLAVSDLDEEKSQISHGETVRETANMISFLTEAIGIRDDMFIGKGHTYMKEVAESVEEGYQKGVLPQRPAVINLQCDLDHPTQTMADLLHLENYFGGFENLKGKKIAMTWAYSPSYGKPLSVPQGIIALMSRFGMDVVLAHPEGYELEEGVIKVAGEYAEQSGGSFKIVNSMEEAFKDADIVYPKSWAPYRVMLERTKLLEKKNYKALDELEKEALAENAKFKHWTCDEDKMKLTKNGEALYMHCLPADITGVSCREGEVAADVFEKYRIETYKEAGFKPFVIAAMIMACRFENPGEILEKIITSKKKRVLF